MVQRVVHGHSRCERSNRALGKELLWLVPNRDVTRVAAVAVKLLVRRLHWFASIPSSSASWRLHVVSNACLRTRALLSTNRSARWDLPGTDGKAMASEIGQRARIAHDIGDHSETTQVRMRPSSGLSVATALKPPWKCISAYISFGFATGRFRMAGFLIVSLRPFLYSAHAWLCKLWFLAKMCQNLIFL